MVLPLIGCPFGVDFAKPIRHDSHTGTPPWRQPQAPLLLYNSLFIHILARWIALTSENCWLTLMYLTLTSRLSKGGCLAVPACPRLPGPTHPNF